MQIVRINKYPESDINAYAKVDTVDVETGAVRVTNLNMPFAGTLAYESFEFDEVTFVKEIA